MVSPSFFLSLLIRDNIPVGLRFLGIRSGRPIALMRDMILSRSSEGRYFNLSDMRTDATMPIDTASP